MDCCFLDTHYTSDWNKGYISQSEKILLFISWSKYSWVSKEKDGVAGLHSHTEKVSRAGVEWIPRHIRKTYSSAQGWVAEPNKHLGWKGLLKSPGPTQDELLCLSVLLSLLPFHNLQKKEVLQSLQTTCFSTFY